MMLKALPVWGFFTGISYWLWQFIAPRHSDLMLENKVVIITGASGGIGQALAFSFAKRGAKVVLTARRQETLEAVARAIEPYATATHIIAVDLTDADQRTRIIRETVDTFGQVDILVNNAGISGGGLFQDNSPQRIDTTIQLNLLAPIQLTHQVLPIFLAQGSGAIVNVGSGLGRVAFPTYVAYCASKYGLSGFTDALRREIQGSGVRLMLALPGWTRTEMVPPQMIEQLQARGFQIEEPDAVAEAIVAGLVQGREELILGGWVAQLGVFTERYAPILHRIYWRFALTRAWIDASRHTP